MNPIELSPIQFSRLDHLDRYIVERCWDRYGNAWDRDSRNLTENCNLYIYTNGPIHKIQIKWEATNGISFEQCVCPQFTYFGDREYRFFLSTETDQLGRYVIIVPKHIDIQLHEAIQEFNIEIAGYIEPILII